MLSPAVFVVIILCDSCVSYCTILFTVVYNVVIRNEPCLNLLKHLHHVFTFDNTDVLDLEEDIH